MPEKVIRRFEMGVGYAYNMAGRWIGLGALTPKKNQACKKLVGMGLLMRKFRSHKIRIVAEVLEERADQMTIEHDCTATCETACPVCARKQTHIMLDAVAPDPQETPGPGDLGVMMRWNFFDRADGVWACKGEHHRSEKCSRFEFKLSAVQERWYRTYLAHGAHS